MATAELVIRDEPHYLEVVSEVRDLVARIEQAGDAKQLADRARAAQVWAQRARLGDEQVNLAATARLWAERRAGELLIELRVNRERVAGGPGSSEAESHGATLDDLGITKHESSRYQRLAIIPQDDFADALKVAAEQGAVSRAGIMAIHYSSETDDWATPQDLFDELDSEFSFTLDVCASSENSKCRRFLTSADDGLLQQWTGSCWMNPPYGRVIGEWVRKAYESSSRDGTTVVCLVPARTDTEWWWNYCRFGEIRFLRGRLKFGGSPNSAPFPSAVVIFPREPKTIWWERG